MTDLNQDIPIGPFPKKSTKVGRGSVIGGLWNIMEKPAGVEEGMEGVPIAHPKCQQFFKNMLDILENPNKNYELKDFKDQKEFDRFIQLKNSVLENKALLERFEKLKVNFKTDSNLSEEENIKNKINVLLDDNNELIKHRYKLTGSELNKIFFKFGKLHEVNAFRSYYENVGMTGLLFKEYEKNIGVDQTKHFAVQNNTFIDSDGNDVWMTKMDGKKMPFFNRTAPGFRRLLKTEVGQNFQILANPFVVLGTGGLSLVGFGALTLGWRGALLARGKISTINSDAIVETLATKMANIRGFPSQEMRVADGSYDKPGLIKKVGAIKWAKGCESMSSKLAGGEKNKTNVIIYSDKNKNHIRVDKHNDIIRIVPNPKDPDNAKNFKYEKVNAKTGKVEPSSKSEYDKAFLVSEDRISGLGESLAAFITMGDRDGIGEIGQNKILRKLDKPRGKFTHEFFGIDFGKAYENNENTILNKKKGNLQDDFSFINSDVRKERFLNVSILYDNPLREKMKGIYLMAALRNKLDPEQKNKIVAEFRDKNNPAYDPDFANKLEGYPESIKKQYSNPNELIHKTQDGDIIRTSNGDLFLIKLEESKYRGLAAEGAKKLENQSLSKKERAILKNEVKEYLAYADRLNEVYKTAQETDKAMLEVFEKRMNLTPSQLDVIDNFEKLTAKKASVLSGDGKVILNHIEVKREDRVAWQITPPLPDGDKNFRLYCEADKAEHSNILKKLNKYAENSELKDIIQKIKLNETTGKIEATLTTEELNLLSKILTEESVVKARKEDKSFTGAKLFRTQKQKNAFHAVLNPASEPSPEQSASSKLSNRLSSILEVDTSESPRHSISLSQDSDSLFTVSDPDDLAPRRRDSVRASQRNSVSPFSDDASPRRRDSVRDSSGPFSDDNVTFTPRHSGPARALAITQDATLKNVINYFKNDESKTNHPNIKNIDELKQIAIPSNGTTPPKPITVNLAKPGSSASDPTIDVTIKQALNGNQVQYFAPKNLPKDDFKFTAAEICKLAVLSSQPGAKFDFSKASHEKQVILKKEFEKAVDKAVLQGKFTRENAPRLKDAPDQAPKLVEQKRPGSTRY